LEPVTAALLYLAAFRVAMIAAGIVAIVLGYRLFTLGARPRSASDRDASITGEIAGAKLTMSNFAPGTGFALFGVIIIGLQFTGIGPEAPFDFLDSGPLKKAGLRGNSETIFSQANAADSLIAQTADNALATLDQRPEEAKEITLEALSPLATHFNNLAWVLAKTDPKVPQARPLAELALAINPKDPNAMHTLAEIEYANGNRGRAIQLLEQANDLLRSTLGQQLDAWRAEKRQ
jgi:hypothetical protein